MLSKKLKYVGWQVGITYQANDKKGLDRNYVENLLTEMKNNGMNFISFMMLSYRVNDSVHDGYAWPVRNSQLRCYIDKKCLNADFKTEFLKDIIEKFGNDFHIDLFTNQFWWNPKKAKIGYPGIQPIDSAGNKDKLSQNYQHCSDNKDTWKMACDEVEDLFSYYSSGVKSYGFEMLGQGGCRCQDTMKMFEEELEKAGLKYNKKLKDETLFRLWQSMRRKQVLEEFVIHIKNIKPNIEIWHCGYMELNDYGGNRFSADSYKKAGIDVAIPCVHMITDENMLKNVLKSSEDFPMVLHIDTRDKPTLNYPVPLKTSEYILNMGKWIRENKRENLVGVVFFNEVATSEKNKKAVYQVIEQWYKEGLL